MSATVQTTFVLTGDLAGLTIRLGSLPYVFENGRLTITASAEEMTLHARFLERNWQAYPEGHSALKDKSNGQRNLQEVVQSSVHSNVQSSRGGAETNNAALAGGGSVNAQTGQAGKVSRGDGQPSIVNVKLQRAVLGLDPKDDAHWTKDGKPAITAVEKLYGSTGIVRADIEAAAPGYTRDKAKITK